MGIEIVGNDSGWKMESIIACGQSDEHPNNHVYLVKWECYLQNENKWEMSENVLEC
jgi:hypothetical protein